MRKRQGIKSIFILGLLIVATLALVLVPNQAWAPPDRDGDGFDKTVDCNDNNPDINPGVTEVCGDGIDNNCNDQIDENCAPCTDGDEDGYFAESGCAAQVDCDDNNPTINPGADEVCGDGIDNNCNDQIDENCAACTDGDEDGYFAEIDCGTPVDCNDNNPTINPGVTEVCSDGIDNNCDDNLDEGCGGVADTDGDGFYDQEELLGILLPPGLTITLPDGTTTNLLPPCGDSPADRSFCVDPTTKDLFVILVRATPSHLPQDPLEFVSRPTQEGGLGITVHELISTPDPSGEDPGRSISPNQKAVRVTEDLDTNGEVLGIANYGTPNQLDYAMVYTQRIINHIDSVCEGATTQCADASGISRPALYDLYIKHTIAHEIGHMLALTTDYNERFGGHHYASGSRIIMEQSVKYTSKQGGRNVTFYISTEYADPADIQGAALH